MQYAKIMTVMALAACIGGCGPVLRSSASATPDKLMGHWQVETVGTGPSTLCYAGTAALSRTSSVTDRGTAYLMITRRPSGKIEISVSSGYPYKEKQRVELKIDGKLYRLTPKGSVAWAKTDVMDKTIIDALKKARYIEVRGESESGAQSSDSYSPDGFMDAYLRIKALCP